MTLSNEIVNLEIATEKLLTLSRAVRSSSFITSFCSNNVVHSAYTVDNSGNIISWIIVGCCFNFKSSPIQEGGPVPKR